MRALVQRVKQASVTVDGEITGAIDGGLLIFLGVRTSDTPAEAAWIVDKCLNLRIFTDLDGKFNLSALDVSADILVVSQFTLYGDSRKGRRPSFVDAARPELAIPLYEHVVELFERSGLTVATGRFAADMQVALVNDGPVTLLVERESPAASGTAD